MIAWFQDAYNNFLAWLNAAWSGALQFFQDLPIVVLDSFLSAVSTVVGVLPAPTFAAGGLQSLFNALDPAVIYFLSRSGMTEGLAILAAGLTFRLLRKLITLGQW